MNHLLKLKEDHFVLWRPLPEPVPELLIGQMRLGNPPQLFNVKNIKFSPYNGMPDLWVVPISAFPQGYLKSGEVYHYFFRVMDSNPHNSQPEVISCTDPFAYAVDWAIEQDGDPAAVVKFVDGKLVPADIGGEEADWGDDEPLIAELPANNQLVIYEIPASWTREGEKNGKMSDVGSFQDLLSLVLPGERPLNFAGVPALEGRSHLQELGINVLELLPPQDSHIDHEWGYATSNYLAPDYDLGKPFGYSWSAPLSSLVKVIKACHENGIRLFVDMAMGFANKCPFENINFMDFHVKDGSDPEKDDRQDWGGQLFKYAYLTHGYEPLSGTSGQLYPARQFMFTQLEHWMRFYRIDGIRIDSIKTIMNWDFVGEFKDYARKFWSERAKAEGLSQSDADRRFIVCGEVLDHHEEKELIRQGRVDSIWNEGFRGRVRSAILGETSSGDGCFVETVRKMIDCREVGFPEDYNVVNYVTSHDVEGYRQERLYNFLDNCGIYEKEQRGKLAFVCLLTAVGKPMILAGEEFLDQHDLETKHPDKQRDSVNFERYSHSWRKRHFDYVARLIEARKTHPALCVNDVRIFHSDFTNGRKVIAYQRGIPGSGDLAVVVANFSGWGTEEPLSSWSEYVVPNWPTLPPGKSWREVTRGRDVDPEWVGRESLFPWEAKVYVTV